jgi:hypothetical protein
MGDIFNILTLTEEIKDRILAGHKEYNGMSLPRLDDNLSKRERHSLARSHGRQIAEIIKKYGL